MPVMLDRALAIAWRYYYCWLAWLTVPSVTDLTKKRKYAEVM